DDLGACRLRHRRAPLRYAWPAAAGVPAAPEASHQAAEGGAPAPGPADLPEPGSLSGLPPSAVPRRPRTASALLLSAEASATLIVLRTPPGAAQLLASTIDLAGWRAVLGTVGGDDTVLVVSRAAAGRGARAPSP